MWLFFFGIVGLLLISIGVLAYRKKNADVLYIIGGLSLLVYSFGVGDLIFIFLQLVFIAAATWDLFTRV